MKICCPVCGVDFPLLAGVNDADARRCAALMGEIPPPIARLIIPYLGMFKPPHQGLRWGKMVNILQDIVPEIKNAQINRNGRIWAAPQDAWVSGLQIVLDKKDLRLPLKGNGLLREIIAAQANRTEGKAETKREEDRAHGYQQRRSGSGPVKVGKVVDKENLKRGMSMLKGALKK